MYYTLRNTCTIWRCLSTLSTQFRVLALYTVIDYLPSEQGASSHPALPDGVSTSGRRTCRRNVLLSWSDQAIGFFLAGANGVSCPWFSVLRADMFRFSHIHINPTNYKVNLKNTSRLPDNHENWLTTLSQRVYLRNTHKTLWLSVVSQFSWLSGRREVFFKFTL